MLYMPTQPTSTIYDCSNMTTYNINQVSLHQCYQYDKHHDIVSRNLAVQWQNHGSAPGMICDGVHSRGSEVMIHSITLHKVTDLANCYMQLFPVRIKPIANLIGSALVLPSHIQTLLTLPCVDEVFCLLLIGSLLL